MPPPPPSLSTSDLPPLCERVSFCGWVEEAGEGFSLAEQWRGWKMEHSNKGEEGVGGPGGLGFICSLIHLGPAARTRTQSIIIITANHTPTSSDKKLSTHLRAPLWFNDDRIFLFYSDLRAKICFQATMKVGAVTLTKTWRLWGAICVKTQLLQAQQDSTESLDCRYTLTSFYWGTRCLYTNQ